MKYPFSKIKLRHTEDIPLTEEEFLKKRRGEILHFTLSFITYREDFQNVFSYLEKALSFFGERKELWDIEEDLLPTLKSVFSLKESELFFPSLNSPLALFVKVLKERNFFAGGRVFRPDRVVIYPEKAVVVDFKSHFPDNEIQKTQAAQVEGYCRIVSKVYKRPTEGYLLYLQPLTLKKIASLNENG